MKNKFILIILLIFSLFLNSCNTKQSTEKNLIEKINQHYKDGIYLNDGWYNLERTECCERADKKTAFTEFKFTGYIDFVNSNNEKLEGFTNAFKFYRETILMDKNGIVDKKIIVESYLKDKKFYQNKQIIKYDGINELSNENIIIGNNRVANVPIYICDQSYIFNTVLYKHYIQEENCTGGNYILIEDDALKSNLPYSDCVYQEIYFDLDNMDIYKYVDNMNEYDMDVNMYQTILEKTSPINDINIPSFDKNCDIEDVKICLRIDNIKEEYI